MLEGGNDATGAGCEHTGNVGTSIINSWLEVALLKTTASNGLLGAVHRRLHSITRDRLSFSFCASDWSKDV